MALRDWGNLIKSGGQSVGTSAKNMTEIAKRNGQIQEASKRINALYLEIGKAYFSLHSVDSEPELSDLVRDVLREQEKIQILNEEIKQIKGMIKCPVCGCENGSGALFCSSCGSSLIVKPKPAPQPASAAPIFCTNCGAKLQAGMAFCTSCGKPVGVQNTAAPAVNEPVIQPAVQEEKAEGQLFCLSCGHVLAPGMDFCTECGAPVKREEIKAEDAVQIEEAVQEEAVQEETVQEESEREMIMQENQLLDFEQEQATEETADDDMAEESFNAESDNETETDDDVVAKKICPNCNRELGEEYMFCPECGSPLE